MQNIITDISRDIATITINRPDSLNALTPDILDQLHDWIGKLGESDGIRAIVITGYGGKAFAAGCDVGVLSSMSELEIADFMEKGRVCIAGIERCEKPVIAAVRGFALGGGLEIILACDLVIAGESAKFGFPETGLGIIPGFGGTVRLPRRIGVARAKEMIFTGNIIDAETSVKWGIANDIAETHQFDQKLEQWITKINSKSIQAIKSAKKSINYAIENDNSLQVEREEFLKCFTNPSSRHFLDTFQKKSASKPK